MAFTVHQTHLQKVFSLHLQSAEYTSSVLQLLKNIRAQSSCNAGNKLLATGHTLVSLSTINLYTNEQTYTEQPNIIGNRRFMESFFFLSLGAQRWAAS